MATTCNDASSIYSDIEFCQGKKSLPGVQRFVYGISKRDIAKWPAQPASTSLAERAAYVGDFELVEGKFFHKLDLIPDENDLKCESQGSYGSKTFKVIGTFLLPGTEEEATGYIAEANNDDMIYLVPARNGKYRVVGCEEFSTLLTLSQDSGKAATDTNSTTIVAEATDPNPAPFYVGQIETADGIINETQESGA